MRIVDVVVLSVYITIFQFPNGANFTCSIDSLGVFHSSFSLLHAQFYASKTLLTFVCCAIMFYYATLLVVIDSVGCCSGNAQP